MKRVLITQSGFVTMVPVAPAVMAAMMCSEMEFVDSGESKLEERVSSKYQSKSKG